MLHIGSKIEAELKEQRRSVQWLAKELYCDRTNVYKILKKESIDTNLLYRISKILSYNFFKHLSDDFSNNTKCG